MKLLRLGTADGNGVIDNFRFTGTAECNRVVDNDRFTDRADGGFYGHVKSVAAASVYVKTSVKG